MDYVQARDNFLKWTEISGFAEGTVIRRRTSLVYFEKFLLFKHKLGEAFKSVTREDMIEFGQSVSQTGLSHTSRQTILLTTRHLFTYLVKDGVLLINPAEGLFCCKKHPTKYPKILTNHEMIRLLSLPFEVYYQGLRDKAVLEILYSSGLRISELCSLKVEDVDLDKGFIFVRQGKGGKDRVVPVGKKACEAVRKYLKSGDRRPCIRKKSQALFLSSRGDAICTSAVWRMVKQKARFAGVLKRVYPHLIRHTCATHLLRAGAHISVVQGILGHESLASTQVYTHLDLKMLRNCYEKYHPQARWLCNLQKPLKNTSSSDVPRTMIGQNETIYAQP